MATRIINLVVASVVLSFCSAAYAQTAREILNGMVAQYRSLSSYSDTGDVIVAQAEPKIAPLQDISFQRPPRAGDTLVSFRTYFARPKFFRFDWKSSRTRSRDASVWSDGKKIYEWLPEVATRDDSFTLTG
jgi:outer membrane lipoprotein-sorting protein